MLFLILDLEHDTELILIVKLFLNTRYTNLNSRSCNSFLNYISSVINAFLILDFNCDARLEFDLKCYAFKYLILIVMLFSILDLNCDAILNT